MQRPAKYQTRQRQAILCYIAALGGAHVTAAQIVRHFQAAAPPIGRTTVYRHLAALTASGDVRRYTLGGISGACYQHVESSDGCTSHLHLKCDCCGELQHLEGGAWGEMQQVLARHAFEVNALKTVLYGTCAQCQHTKTHAPEKPCGPNTKEGPA